MQENMITILFFADTRFSQSELKKEVENTLLRIPFVHGFFSHRRFRYEPCGAVVPKSDPTTCVARVKTEEVVVAVPVVVEMVVFSMVVFVRVALTSVTVVVGATIVPVVVDVVAFAVVVASVVVVEPVEPTVLYILSRRSFVVP
jgi:hypothetical protein